MADARSEPDRRTALAAAFALPGGIGWDAVGFAVRTTAASLVALYIALLLDLDEPKWAAMTVWIVAQSSRGMSLSKSQYRLLGTVAGAAVGLALVALFAQTPELFFGALAGWLGLCTAASTGLRNFRSYGAVLAGYTAAIIGISAASAPDQAFEIAVARVVYITLGILVEAVFTAIFAPDAPLPALRARLDGFLRQAAAVSARALRGEDNSAALRGLFAAALALDAAAEYAAAGSREVRRRYGHLRGAVAACLARPRPQSTAGSCASGCGRCSPAPARRRPGCGSSRIQRPRRRASHSATTSIRSRRSATRCAPRSRCWQRQRCGWRRPGRRGDRWW